MIDAIDNASEFTNTLQVREEKIRGDIESKLEEVKGTVKEVQKSSKRYLRSTLFSCGSLFLLNGLLLYFGTMSGSSRIDLARFYGFREGKNEHMQRSIGMFCIFLASTNFAPLLNIYSDEFKDELTTIALVGDIISFVHYTIETLYFKGIRLEVVFCMGTFLILNVFWTIKEMYFAKRERDIIVIGKDKVDVVEKKIT